MQIVASLGAGVFAQLKKLQVLSSENVVLMKPTLFALSNLHLWCAQYFRARVSRGSSSESTELYRRWMSDTDIRYRDQVSGTGVRSGISPQQERLLGSLGHPGNCDTRMINSSAQKYMFCAVPTPTGRARRGAPPPSTARTSRRRWTASSSRQPGAENIRSC